MLFRSWIGVLAAVIFGAMLFVGGVLSVSADEGSGVDRLPNIVIMLADDQGYQDVGCFGSPNILTPNLDRMASEGVRFTDFYVAQAVCSASRVGLLTGCHSHRVGITGALGPNAKIGINDSEMLISEVCKQKGYATAIYGKWHLGDEPQFLPTRHGFDEYFGLPYSNDMWPYHPQAKPGTYPPLPLYQNEETLKVGLDQNDMNMLTTWYTEHAVDFIKRNKDKPFFLYVPQSMPHVPLGVSDKFRGKSEQGPYGDVIMEIDWSMGEILKTLKECGIDDNTLVVYTSDNGPWLSYGDHAGSALPLREGKGTSWDGGQRTPCIMRWPNRIPAGKVCNEMASTIDLLPTIAGLIGAELPEHKIDGLNILPLMTKPDTAKTPHEYFPFFYYGNELHAVRSDDWKLHFVHKYRSLGADQPGKDGIPCSYVMKNTGPELELYNLKDDISESKNVAAEHPEIVEKLKAYAEDVRVDLGDKLTKTIGAGVRQPGRADASNK